MKRAIILILIVGFFGISALIGYCYFEATIPIQMPALKTGISSSQGGQRFKIEKGWGAGKIATELAQHNFIKSPFIFKLTTRLMQAEAHFKAGNYQFTGDQSVVNIIKILQEGQVLVKSLSIAEGLNQWQIAEKIVSTFPQFQKSEIEKEFSNPELLKLLPAEAKTIEGYLFPETYTLAEDAQPQEILRTMIDLFNQKLTPERQLQARDLGFSVHNLVTLASIIEKETGAPEERGIISAVFHNRLRMKMRLQTDPTVIYGMWAEYDGNIRKKDLQRSTPYNTYIISGLPPGPIASPGLDALNKAAKPDSSDALYFVALGDGSGRHAFSKSLIEHNRAVRMFLDRQRKGRIK